MAAILESVVSTFVVTLASLAKDEIVLLMGIGDETERFRERLERILPVLADADMRRLQDEGINTWVRQLRSVVYDAEDMIDECRIEAEKHGSIGIQRPSSSPLPVSFCHHLFSCFSQYGARRHHIGKRIKTLNQKLDDILKDILLLNMRSAPRNHHTDSSGISRKTSPLAEPDLVGETIEEDTRMLVDLLLSKEYKGQQKMSVFALVGMGGVGKTTLAQKIYNDDKLRAEFSNIPPIWVCVSQDFSEVDLLRVIITRAGGNPGETKDKELLEPMLNDIVTNKKFFLVLDDVWNAQVWEKLLYKPLQSGSIGSIVLVTTRDTAVAMHMRAVRCHQVEKLSDEDGWSLVCKMVFLGDEDIASTQYTLRDVGMRIVRKCDGLPLALKTIAGVLRNKDKKQNDWDKVLQNPMWSLTELPDGVMGALYLSYLELPSHLKQCFQYFALFPKDATLLRSHFIRYWIAEGFVEEKENMMLEELAKEYWMELVHRNLLQPQTRWYDSSVCNMHDLLHSLAQHLASDECFCGTVQDLTHKTMRCSSSFMKPRRVCIRNNGEAILDVIKEHVSLRTLLFPSIENFTEDISAKLRCLRVLNISESSIEELPDSIGGLIHLRCLDLSFTAIREIPESIGNLGYLQFLNMYQCQNLHNLPNTIVNLRNLRSLYLVGTKLQSIPIGIGRLQNLVELCGFVVSGSNTKEAKQEHRQQNSGRCSSLAELGSLNFLMNLLVYNLERTSSREVARAAMLKAKPHLTRLELHCMACSADAEPYAYYGPEGMEKISEVLEELCPPPCLERLTIEGYLGLEFPSWMMMMPASILPNLRRLELINCLFCEQLPPLGLLLQLDYLRIAGASAVKSIGPELFGVCCTADPRGGEATRPRSFPKLEKLYFEKLPNLEEWCWFGEEEKYIPTLLPCLYHITLKGCSKLQSLPVGLLCHATALTSLWIEGAHCLTQINDIYYVEQLQLIDNPNLEQVSDLPALKKLCVVNCRKLKAVENLNELKLIVLRDLVMGTLPEWLLVAGERLQFGALRRLEIEGNTKFLLRCLVGGPDWHKIRQILRVDAYDNYERPNYYIHYTRSPFSFSNNLFNDIF